MVHKCHANHEGIRYIFLIIIKDEFSGPAGFE
jgi:hypothetical protein